MPEAFAAAHARLTAVRDRTWRDDPEEPDRPETIQAMPMVLHVPKNPAPERTALLEAAGASVVACCLDERAGGDTAFAEALTRWYGLRIRKIARRARATKWDRVQTLPGVTAEVRGCQARAFVPCPVSETPPELSKLQIEGTDVPAGDPVDPPQGPHAVVYVDAGLGMSVGKAAAQVGHATMLLAADMDGGTAWAWAQAGWATVVREFPRDAFEVAVARARAASPGAVVADAGYTEVAPGSVTVCATWEPGAGE
ncbi:peptidyl-tRNA hydrolase [Corynebacterium sp. 335C]